MLHQGHEGDGGIVDVQPVRLAQGLLQLQDEADIGQVLDLPQLLAVGGRQPGGDVQQDLRRCGD